MRWSLAIAIALCGCGESALQATKSEGVPAEAAPVESSPTVAVASAGEWRKIRPDAPVVGDAGRDADGASTGFRSVTVHDSARAFQGYNLYNSGHAAAAYLVDMDGRVLHTWRARADDVLGAAGQGDRPWRRVRLGADGALYAVWDGLGVVKLDKDSHVLWAKACEAHDDLQILDRNRLIVLARDHRIDARYSRSKPIVEDIVEVRDGATGELKQRHSVLDAFAASADPGLAAARRGASEDILHTNAVEILGADGVLGPPTFRPGMALVSLQHASALALLDLTTDRFTWSYVGGFRSQGGASVGASGELAVFDGSGGDARTSRVVILDPSTGQPTWTWEGTRKQPLRSEDYGDVQLLPNGDVLVTESEAGRAFEVTRDTRETVWEFYNPHRGGDQGDRIAVLFEVQRLPASLDLDWARADASPVGAGPVESTPAGASP